MNVKWNVEILIYWQDPIHPEKINNIYPDMDIDLAVYAYLVKPSLFVLKPCTK